MSFIDTIFGRSSVIDEAEEELGRPDLAEEIDLSLHVQRCARRWRMSYRASKQNNVQLTQIRTILLLMILYGIVVSPYGTKIIAVLQAL